MFILYTNLSETVFSFFIIFNNLIKQMKNIALVLIANLICKFFIFDIYTTTIYEKHIWTPWDRDHIFILEEKYTLKCIKWY